LGTGETGVTGLEILFWPSEASEKWSSSPSEDSMVDVRGYTSSDAIVLNSPSRAPGSSNSTLFLGGSRCRLSRDEDGLDISGCTLSCKLVQDGVYGSKKLGGEKEERLRCKGVLQGAKCRCQRSKAQPALRCPHQESPRVRHFTCTFGTRRAQPSPPQLTTPTVINKRLCSCA
jgi:hypothetical protein